MKVLDWFKKAKSVTNPGGADDANNPAAIKQGGYTDHHLSPYKLRMAEKPMRGEEAEAFDWAINKLNKLHKDAEGRQSTLIEYGLSCGVFEVDEDGMLHVSNELPEELQ